MMESINSYQEALWLLLGRTVKGLNRARAGGGRGGGFWLGLGCGAKTACLLKDG